jgi:hypothetical protein
MNESESDYLYEVWRSGGNPDAVDLDEIPRDYDWVWERPLDEHLPQPPANECGQHILDDLTPGER